MTEPGQSAIRQMQRVAGLAGAGLLSALAVLAYRSASPADATTRAGLADAGYTLARHDNAFPIDGVWTAVSHWVQPGTHAPAMVCHVPYGPASKQVGESCKPFGRSKP